MGAGTYVRKAVPQSVVMAGVDINGTLVAVQPSSMLAFPSASAAPAPRVVEKSVTDKTWMGIGVAAILVLAVCAVCAVFAG